VETALELGNNVFEKRNTEKKKKDLFWKLRQQTRTAALTETVVKVWLEVFI
jgi:hypothetical protein